MAKLEMIEKKFMKRVCFNQRVTGQIDILIAYDSRMTNKLMAQAAHDFQQMLILRGLTDIKFPQVLDFLESRMKPDSPDRNVNIKCSGDWIDYSTDSSGGRISMADAVLVLG